MRKFYQKDKTFKLIIKINRVFLYILNSIYVSGRQEFIFWQ